MHSSECCHYVIIKLIQVQAFHLFILGAGLNVSADWLHNVDALKESLKLAGSGSYDLNNIDISQFQGTSQNLTLFG